MHACARSAVPRQTAKGRAEAARRPVESGCFRRPVVRSGGAVRRPGTAPPLPPLPSAEWIVAPASLSPTRDAFSIGDSSRNTKPGFDVTSFHGTQLHDRGTHAEWNQSPVPRRLAARASAAWTALRGCPCLAPVLGSHCRRSHRGRAAGNAGVGQRERPPAVAVPSTRQSVGGHIEVQNATPVMGQYQKHVKHPETEGWQDAPWPTSHAGVGPPSPLLPAGTAATMTAFTLSVTLSRVMMS